MSASAKHDAIPAIVKDCQPDAVVTKFIIVAEVIGADGKRYLWSDSDDDATPWDELGLLSYALGQVECDG